MSAVLSFTKHHSFTNDICFTSCEYKYCISDKKIWMFNCQFSLAVYNKNILKFESYMFIVYSLGDAKTFGVVARWLLI